VNIALDPEMPKATNLAAETAALPASAA